VSPSLVPTHYKRNDLGTRLCVTMTAGSHKVLFIMKVQNAIPASIIYILWHAIPTYFHCKNKLVVLTTEWLLWLQTSWRDSGYERFALGNRS